MVGGGGRWFLGKRILCTDAEADLPAEALENQRKRERTFPFQRASCNFSALVANWQLYRDGEKDLPLYNGCCNCGHKHGEDLALQKGQERLCNVTRKGGRGSKSVGPIKILKE